MRACATVNHNISTEWAKNCLTEKESTFLGVSLGEYKSDSMQASQLMQEDTFQLQVELVQ